MSRLRSVPLLSDRGIHRHGRVTRLLGEVGPSLAKMIARELLMSTGAPGTVLTAARVLARSAPWAPIPGTSSGRSGARRRILASPVDSRTHNQSAVPMCIPRPLHARRDRTGPIVAPPSTTCRSCNSCAPALEVLDRTKTPLSCQSRNASAASAPRYGWTVIASAPTMSNRNRASPDVPVIVDAKRGDIGTTTMERLGGQARPCDQRLDAGGSSGLVSGGVRLCSAEAASGTV